MNSINYDNLNMIISFLEPEDIDSLCKTNIQFKILCTDPYSILWKKLMMRDYPNLCGRGDYKNTWHELNKTRDGWIVELKSGIRHIERAFLTSANLNKISVSVLKISESNFEGTRLSNSYLKSVYFEGCELMRSIFTSTSIDNVGFSDCNLDNANFEYAILEYTTFTNCSLRDANFSNSSHHNSGFSNTDLTNTDFSKSFMDRVHFMDHTILINTKFLQARIRDPFFARLDLGLSNFTGASVNDPEYATIDMTVLNRIGLPRF